jgi:hypothetical protein
MEKIIAQREQLLSYIIKKIVYVYIKRAINDGPVENLGAFDPGHLDWSQPGWIVKVTTRTKRIIYVSVLAQPLNSHYTLFVSDEVCWRNWIGDKYTGKKLYEGDNPGVYAAYRDQEIEDGTD